MTTQTYTNTYNPETGEHQKGALVQARVIRQDMSLYGVITEWAVSLVVASPTGDSSDFLDLDIPCLSLSQACAISDNYNRGLAPELVGVFERVHSPSQSLNTPNKKLLS